MSQHPINIIFNVYNCKCSKSKGVFLLSVFVFLYFIVYSYFGNSVYETMCPLLMRSTTGVISGTDDHNDD
jgi:hypothetical protein